MNKYFINGKFNFNNSVEMVEKRSAANKYIADTERNFIRYIVKHILDLAEEVQDMRNIKHVTGKQYLKRLSVINRTIEYHNEIMRRLADNEK